MFRQFLHRASQASIRGRVGRSIALTSGLAFAGTGVALAHSGPEKIELADVQTGVVQLSDRDFDTPSQSVLDEERAAAEQGGQGQSAYNPVTGEINWDCPCLGGMAHGPCGPEFKEAFACFIYSTEEIKGSECIPKFSAMQNCFRQYPEVYADFQEDTQAVASADAAAAAESKAGEAVTDTKEAAVDAKDAAVAKTKEIKDTAEVKADETKKAAEAKLGEAKKTAEAKSTQAKDAAAAKLTQVEDAAAAKASEYKEAAAASLEQAKAQASQNATDLKESASAEKAKWSESLSDAASQAAQQTSSAWDDATARMKTMSMQASEIASAKTSELASKASESNQNLTKVVSDYTSWVQQAAKEVVEEASNKSEQLNAADISELIEQKLNEAHKDAAELFANTTSSYPQNAATFASDAVQGIAAEAKEAVNYVAKGVNDTFGKNK